MRTTSRSRPAAVAAGILFALPAAAQEAGIEPEDTDYDRVPLNTVIPEYPEKARRERIEGEVQVCFDISREGLPRRVAIRRSTHRYFEKPARDAVRRSSWRPRLPAPTSRWSRPSSRPGRISPPRTTGGRA